VPTDCAYKLQSIYFLSSQLHTHKVQNTVMIDIVQDTMETAIRIIGFGVQKP